MLPLLMAQPRHILAAHSQNPEKTNPPQPPAENEVALNPGEKHTHSFTLQASDYLELRVKQRGVDVTLRLLGTDGTVIQEVNKSTGLQGTEVLRVIVDQAGTYVLEVATVKKTGQAGTYLLEVQPPRTATGQDRATIEIEGLHTQFEKLRQTGKLDDALPLVTQTLEKSEAAFGPEHRLVAISLNHFGLYAQAKNDFSRAESFFLRALAIYEKVLGPESLAVTDPLDNLGNLYRRKAEYAKAEPLYLRSLAIKEKQLGPDHQSVAQTLHNLANFYRDKADYTSAEPLYLRSLALFEKSLGPEHPLVATSLMSLANLYQLTGKYTKAEPLYLQALAMFEKSLGPEHPSVASTLNNLAGLYQNRGDFAKAEALHERSLAIREKILGPNHPTIIQNLNNLSVVYLMKGDLTKAEPLFHRALATSEKAFGPDHLNTILSRANLAQFYLFTADYARAVPLFEQSLAAREKVQGPDHPNLGPLLNNLALIYKTQGDVAKAESFYQRALTIYEKAFGPDYRGIGANLSNLALILLEKGDFARSEQLYQRALAISEKALGPEHPDVSLALSNLSMLNQAKGDLAKAISYQIRCAQVDERDLVRNLISGSERQKVIYIQLSAFRQDRMLTLQAEAGLKNPEALKAALTQVLLRKGRALDAMTNAIGVLRNQSDPQTKKLLDDYAGVTEQLSVLTLRGPGAQKLEEHLATLKPLEAEKERLENEISRRSGEFKAQVTPISLENITQLIPADAALVEFTSYHPFDVKTQKYGELRYVVYVVTRPSGKTHRQGEGPDSSTAPIQWTDLGPAAPIDQLANEFRQALRKKSPLEKVGDSKGTGAQRPVLEIARELDQLVMQPVRKLVGNARHLLMSPEGELNLIPFAALVNEQGSFLVEHYTLTYLTSGRDLLRLQVKIAPAQPPLIVADPDYAEGGGPTLFGTHLPPLKRLLGTKVEARMIQTEFPDAEVKLGPAAGKMALEAVEKPELLHIATHGYFMGGGNALVAVADNQRALAKDDEQPINIDQIKRENPFLRSVLFFADANRSEQGTMTALEVAQLNLWGTKLVALSACDTGVGEIKNGDGVYGLRRALVLAGSEAQMISLWAVSDSGTQELMANYYKRLKAGEGRSEALRNVQLKMLKNPRRRHPFYWASFIQSGEWKPL
ncbi:MAG TPA: CHAT domain-containing protein [Acidobacteriota bacterium]|nr:CHAT domain-containing protein [Acidobacteriota bacterium]